MEKEKESSMDLPGTVLLEKLSVLRSSWDHRGSDKEQDLGREIRKEERVSKMHCRSLPYPPTDILSFAVSLVWLQSGVTGNKV